MIRDYHNHSLQTNPLHREEEPQNINSKGWSIVYIEGSHVIIFKEFCISFSENQFGFGKQCRPG